MRRKQSILSWFQIISIITSLSFLSDSLQSVRAAEVPTELDGVGVTEYLGRTLRLEQYHFVDDSGQSVQLSHYFKQGKPVVLALVYYQCPQLCNLILNGLLSAMKEMAWSAGQEFELVAVSINPQETPDLAAQKKKNYLKIYQRASAERGFHFLTAEENQVQTLANELGYHYRYDPKEKQYLHTATLFVLTPEGKISRYLYGVSFKSKDLRLALTEASRGMVGTVMDRILMFCYHFDPSKNSYTFQMWRVVQVVLSIQALALGFILFKLWQSEKKRKARLEDQNLK